MSAIDSKAKAILDHEECFADSLAAKVIDKPRLSVWMILVPIIFIYFFFRMKKFTDGRKDFSSKYILTRKQALSKAVEYVKGDRNAGAEDIVKKIDMNERQKKYYREILSVLHNHYVHLLTSNGATYEELVRKSYKSRDNFMKHISEINEAEREFNRCFIENTEDPEITGIIDSIMEHSGLLRTELAGKIFS